jgi:hypothetical protein
LLVAGSGELWILVPGQGWLRRQGEVFRRTEYSAVAVDADGRIWLGTQHGPLVPGLEPGPPVPAIAFTPGVAHLVAGAVRVLDQELGPPPCRRTPFDPLPRARLIVGSGRGSTREVGLPGPSEQAELRTWVYVEVELSWTFGPLAPTECVGRFERWSELGQERRQRVSVLHSAWSRAAGGAEVAGDLAEAVEARMERDRLAELIRIVSGVDPREEER